MDPQTLMKGAIGAVLVLGLAACRPEAVDTWCLTHRLEDVQFSAASVRGMEPADRRKYLAILREGAALCGWQPVR